MVTVAKLEAASHQLISKPEYSAPRPKRPALNSSASDMRKLQDWACQKRLRMTAVHSNKKQGDQDIKEHLHWARLHSTKFHLETALSVCLQHDVH